MWTVYLDYNKCLQEQKKSSPTNKENTHSQKICVILSITGTPQIEKNRVVSIKIIENIRTKNQYKIQETLYETETHQIWQFDGGIRYWCI